jgi:phage terminase large subunit-like protein
LIWAPDTDWAEDLIEECAAFPVGKHDDQVDSTTAALMRFRQGNFVSLPSDYMDEEIAEKDASQYVYY